MHKIDLSQNGILSLLSRTWQSVNKEVFHSIYNESGGIDPLEGLVLHCYVLDKNPMHSIEFSPNLGYSTKWIGSALKSVNNPESFWTFEKNTEIIERLEKNLGELKDRFVKVVVGDAKKEVVNKIKKNNLSVELCVIDSDHSGQFARYYLEQILPVLSSPCLVFIHDICCNNEQLGSSLYNENGECQEVVKYLGQNKIHYLSLHKITGGKHENANRKINKEFYKEVEKITGIDFLSQERDICPKSLWFYKE